MKIKISPFPTKLVNNKRKQTFTFVDEMTSSLVSSIKSIFLGKSTIDFGVISWNVNGVSPLKLEKDLPQNVDQLFPSRAPSFLVFGLQEYDSRPSSFFKTDNLRYYF